MTTASPRPSKGGATKDSFFKAGTRTAMIFEGLDTDKCINRLVYGTKVRKVVDNKPSKAQCIISIREANPNELQILDSAKVTNIDLGSISSIQEVVTIKNKNLDVTNLLEILYGNNKKLILAFDQKDSRTTTLANSTVKNEFWKGLSHIIEKHEKDQATQKNTNENFGRDVFAKVDSSGNQSLDRKEVKEMIKKLGLNADEKYVDKMLEEFDVNKDGQMSFDEFNVFIKSILQKEEVSPIFHKYATQSKTIDGKEVRFMTPRDLIRFYQEEQNQDNMTLEGVQALSDALTNAQIDDPCVSLDVFNNILFSPANIVFDPKKSKCYQDMTKPLSDYFINSSHNTYLMSNQLVGDSSVQAYINALKKGCRCVELDLWDGPNNEPIVYHGHTMTTKLLFSDIIKTLREHAFAVNPYPMILSFEMHCGIPAQKRIYKILKQEIEHSIFTIPADYHNYQLYPSPESLKYKFIIKCKGKLGAMEDIADCEEHGNPENSDKHRRNMMELEIRAQAQKSHRNIFADFGTVGDTFNNQHPNFNIDNTKASGGDNAVQVQQNDDFSKKVTIDVPEGQETSRSPVDKTKGAHTVEELNEMEADSDDADDDDDEDEEEGKEKKGGKKEKAKKKIYSKLNSFYALIGRHINMEPGVTKVWEIASLNEHKIEKLYATKLHDVINFHRRILTRIYPGNLRVSSSNYNPIPSWACGAQVVALNFQNKDESMLLNYAKFKANGKVGFNLKPKYMLSEFGVNQQLVSATGEKQKPLDYYCDTNTVRKRVTIQVISAQALGSLVENSGRVINPFVEVKLRGVEPDEKRNQIYKTHSVSKNSFHPIWQTGNKKCEYTFDIAAADFATFVFTVYSDDRLGNNKMGWYAIEFNNLQEGYRAVPLLKADLTASKHCYLFCHVKITSL